MTSHQRVPCKCTNPKCGIRFERPSPFSIEGKNNVVINSGVSCPECGSYARIADHGTDSDGKPYVNLNGLFSFLREIKSVNKLEKIKNELESNKDKFEADKLVNKLEEIDPIFSRLKGVIKSVKRETAISIITLMILFITLLMDIQEAQSSEEQFRESKKIEEEKIELLDKRLKVDEEQLQLSKEQFEYQKKNDLEEKELIANKDEENKKRISQLERQIEKLANQEQKRTVQENVTQAVAKKTMKPNLNSTCLCGSGKKTEVCHPFGLVFRINKPKG